MPTRRQAVQRDARAELHAWYATSLRPKLARAESAGLVSPVAVQLLDEQVHDFLDVPVESSVEAA